MLALVLALLAPAGHAETNAAYDAVASAYAFDSFIKNDSIPLGLSPEVAGPVAQVSQSSLPGSEAFASFPYPGDTAVGILPTASSLYGIALPDYPLIAKSSLGAEQPTDVNFPGVALHARTGTALTEATGTAGSDAAGGFAQSRIVADEDGSVTVAAHSKVNLVQLGGLVSFTGVDSMASATLDSSGTVTKTSSLSIGSIAVPGLRLTIPKTTPGFVPLPIPVPGFNAPAFNLPEIPLPLGGQTLAVTSVGFKDGVFTVQLPVLPGVNLPIPAQTVLDAFKALGLLFTIEAPQETDTSIVAPVMTLTTVLPALPQNTSFNGPVTVSIALGRTSVGITSYATGDNGEIGAPSGAPGSSAVASGISPTGGFAAPPVASSGAVAATATGNRGSTPVVAFGAPQYFNASWFYIVFVAVALASFGGSTVLRYLGVRATWI
jgi:hypothetical protein